MLHLYNLFLKPSFRRFFQCESGKAPIKAAGLSGGALAIAVLLLVQLEGVSLNTYLDTAGIPTICYGHTATARIGQSRTAAQCDELLQGDLGIAMSAVHENVTVPITPTMEAALASFTYNVGVGAFKSSTLLRRLNEGRYQDACAQMRRWVCEAAPAGRGDTKGQCATAKRHKRYSKGLKNRREKEIEVCLYAI